MRKTRISILAIFALIPFLFSSSFNNANASLIDETPLNPSLHNLAGEKITTVEVGQQAMIMVPVHNNAQIERSMVILVEVRDGNGVTVFLAWQSATVAANGDYTMGMSWMPNEECGIPNETCSNYEIRSFGITSLVNPEVLSPVAATGGITVTGSPHIPSSPRYYDVFVNNQLFQIEYSFSGEGKMTQIEVDEKVASMTFSLTTTGNSRLSILMPPEFVEYVFADTVATGDEWVVFVDEIAADMKQTIDADTGNFVFEIPLEHAAKQVDLIGSMLI